MRRSLRDLTELLALGVALASSACAIDLPDISEPGRFACSDDGHCAEGFVCVDGFCESPPACAAGRGGDDCHVIWAPASGLGQTRYGHAMAYDESRHVVVSFGGFTGNGSTLTDQVHEWDGTHWVLRCGFGTSCSGPVAREGHGMAYLPGRGVVMVGGRSASGALLTDTWAWNGSSWTALCNALTAPACGPEPQVGRADFGLAYNPQAAALYLFGGHYAHSTTSGLSGFMLVWDDPNRQWDIACNPVSPTSCPSPYSRFGLAMAVDADGGGLIMSGGWNSDAKDTILNDTWSWSGGTWTMLCASSGAPCNVTLPRAQLAFATDTDRHRLVTFGGYYPASPTAEPFANVTREWDGMTWSAPICGAGSPAECRGPAARARHAMAFDTLRGQVVMMGGLSGDTGSCSASSPYCDDTWIYVQP